jgi:hypothetical protein
VEKNVGRRALLALPLLLGALVVVLDRVDAAGQIELFLFAALALLPLSWLIGEATDNLALHTGPGVGGLCSKAPAARRLPKPRPSDDSSTSVCVNAMRPVTVAVRGHAEKAPSKKG